MRATDTSCTNTIWPTSATAIWPWTWESVRPRRGWSWCARAAQWRMGVHAGPVTLVDGDYAGLTVHEASRVCEAAGGGQIVATGAVVETVGRDLPAGTSLLDLGAHRLRDFPDARRLHQIS